MFRHRWVRVRNKTELDCQFAFYSASDPDSYTMIFERGEGYPVDASYEGLVLGYNNQRFDGRF
jgi:hypothetical protein